MLELMVDARWKLLAICRHRGAEPQEGGWIAQAWITDPQVYQGISIIQ